jgi:hypothetical protein
VASGLDRDLELGSDAVGGGDEDGVPIARRLQVEECAEPAEPGVAACARRRAGQRLDRLDQRVAGVDIDSGFLVAPAVLVADGILPGDAL